MLPQPTPVQSSLPRPSASLYVGNLASDVTEANLFETFNQVGLVASIRVCRDTTTRRSLGYAYVNFQNPNDAERALDTLNYTPIKGRACRIMWSQRDPSFRKSGVGNIFIKNLDKSIDNKSLHDTFSAFGNILSCRVMTDEHGNSRGFGFVHFENAESAEQAKAKVDGMLLADQQVFVGLYVSKKERAPKYEELKKTFTNVFVKNLDESVGEEEFQNLFIPHGQITSSVIMRDETGKSRGFGFVNFQTHESAENACDALNEIELHGKKLFVGRAQKSTERKEELQRKHEANKQERHNKFPGVNLYVRNLEDQINDEGLRNEFKEFGTITSAKVAVDERGNSKGFGFVCYSSPEEATRALAEMNGKMIGGKPIYVSPHQRKEVRRQQLEIHYAQNSRLAMQQGYLPNGMYPQGVYYPAYGVPPQARGQQFMGYPMMARPRWAGPQQGAPAQPELVGAYPPQLPGAQVPRPRPMSSAPRTRAPQGSVPARAPIPNGLPAGQPQIPNQGGPRGKSNYRYNSNVRNRVDQPPAVVPVPIPQYALNPTTLVEAPPEVQKRLLGEKLYFLILPKQPELAPKITGMLLDMDNSELLHLLDSSEALQAKIDEALRVLLEQSQTEADPQGQVEGQN